MTTMTVEEQIDQWSNPDRQREPDQIRLAKLMYKTFKSSPHGKWPEGRRYIHAAYWLAEAPPYIYQDRFGETPDQKELVTLWEKAGGSFYVEDGHLRFLPFEEMDEKEREDFKARTSSGYERGNDRGIDIAGYSSDKRMLLAVQVKTIRGTSPDWAVHFRRNLLSHPFLPDATYFLIVTPDAIYLWKNNAPPDALPDYAIDGKEMLEAFANKLSLSLEGMSIYGFEMLVATWLQDLIFSDLSPETADPSLQWLFESGLYAAMKNGLVLLEEVA